MQHLTDFKFSTRYLEFCYATGIQYRLSKYSLLNKKINNCCNHANNDKINEFHNHV